MMLKKTSCKSLKTIAAVAFCIASLAVNAKVCHWSGLGGDGLWTNVNNWVEREVPGRYAGSEQASGEDCDEAVFGAVSEGAATIIDLDGHFCVSNLTFASGAPNYVFGVSPEQVFGLCFKGKIEFEDGAVSTQRFDSVAFIGYWDETIGKERSKGTGNSTAIITIKGSLIDFNEGWKYNYNHYINLRGKGDIRVAKDCTNSYQVNNYLEGRFISALEKPVNNRCYYKSFVSYTVSGGNNVRTVHVPDIDDWFSESDWGNPHFTATFKENTIIDGLGTFGLYNSRPSAEAHGICFNISGNKSLKVYIDVELYTALLHKYIYFAGNGRTELYGEMRGSHYELRIGDSHTLSVGKIGNLGCRNDETSIGTNVSEIVFTSGGTFEYSGLGETTSRAFRMASESSSKVATICNAGNGLLTLKGDFTPTNNTGTLRFEAKTAPISVEGSLSGECAIAMGVAGSHPVIFAKHYPITELNFYGGKLEFGSDMDELKLPPLKVVGGESTVIVPTGKTLEVDSVAIDSGMLEFVIPESSSVRIKNGNTPSGLLVNGYPAQLNADGFISAKVTKWENAVNGEWSDATKWSAGIPQYGWGVEIVASGSSYEVEIKEPVAEYPSILNIRNDTLGAVSKLSSEVPLAFTNVCVSIQNGGVIEAKAGLSFTNDTSETGSFTVSKGGELRVIGGNFNCEGKTCRIKYDGGKVVFDEGATMEYPSVVTFGTGETVFDGDSAFTKSSSGGNIDVLPNAPGETAIFTLAAAKARHNFRSPALVVGGCVCATGIFNSAGADLDTDGTYIASGKTTFGLVCIGFEAGIGIMNVTGGKLFPGNYGFHIGSTHWGSDYYQISKDLANAATGIVVMTGGTISPSGWGYASAKFPLGLVIGDATRPLEGAKSRVRGEFYLNGGVIEPNLSGTYIGVGFADGIFVQNGGTMTHYAYHTSTDCVRYDNPDNKIFEFPFVVGLGGGIGAYVISNGTLTVNSNNKVFVGGATPADLSWCSNTPWTMVGYPVDNHDARGLFAVRGGEVEIGKSIYIGCDGTGELEVAVPGKLTIGGDVVLSNSVASVLRIVLGERSVPDATISGKIFVTDGTKLVVDASAYRSGRVYTRLINPNGGFEGDLSSLDTEIILPVRENGRAPKCAIVTERDGEHGIWLYQQCGMVVTFR